MDRNDVDQWLKAYVDAWKSYESDEIAALFSEDVEYWYHPYEDPVRGRDAVVDSWLGESTFPGASDRDAPGTYDAHYETVAVDGEVAVATGSSTYFEKPGGPIEKVYDNCIIMRFDDEGRCRSYTEWYMKRPNP